MNVRFADRMHACVTDRPLREFDIDRAVGHDLVVGETNSRRFDVNPVVTCRRAFFQPLV